jgi:uncharacterized membrane protein
MTYEAIPPTGGPSSGDPASGGAPLRTGDTDRGLVVLNYIFLLVAPFTLHVLAVVAVILAYVRRPGAPAFEAGHYGFQIKVFWWSVILFALAVVLGLVAFGTGFGAVWQANTVDAWAPHWGVASITAILAAGLAWFASFLVAAIGALIGLIKVLSNEPARRG